jgi:hypothetical protein
MEAAPTKKKYKKNKKTDCVNQGEEASENASVCI